MENKIAVVAIIVNKWEAVEKINAILHDFRDYIIGRMGIPYKQRGISVISVTVDASQEIINSLSGKLGMVDGVTSKVLVSK